MPNRRIKLAPGHRKAPILSGIIKAMADGGGPLHSRRHPEAARDNRDDWKGVTLILIVLAILSFISTVMNRCS